MSTERIVETKASDGKQMTVADVKEWLAEMASAGALNGTPVEARVSLGGGLKSLKATAGDAKAADTMPPGTVVVTHGLN